MLNPSEQSQIVYPGTLIAIASPVVQVQEVRVNKTSTRVVETVPEHLQELYMRTIDGLNPEQSRQVAT
ncbi:hypothetical protein DPMN_074552 [Dreissena polymorpha]|uniref:Uncharacterized protein n=1 Tax=Dreissena polymorpha TaxID=45954 RepID=A0A9D3YIV5_DREPO|nr:hypothetical protein DPMN_074552 [Dreissena polymorpha]